MKNNLPKRTGIALISVVAILTTTIMVGSGLSTPVNANHAETKISYTLARHQTQHHTVNVDGVDIF